MSALKFPATKRQLSLLALAGFAAACSTSVIAQDAPGWYVGGSLGATRADFNNDAINSSLVGKGFPITSTTTDNKDSGGKIFGGYQFTPNFALEGGYFDLGRYSYSTTTPTGTFSGNTKVNGLNLDLVGTAPLSDKFSVIGRIGAAYERSRGSFASTGLVPVNTSSTSTNSTNLKIGLGIQYAISEALSLRAEIERYFRVRDPIRNRANIDMASIGLVYRFGGKVQTPVAQPYVPVVAAPPPPAPVYVAPKAVEAPAPAPVYEAPVRPAKQGRF
ncbi:MAG: outer membrane beta-barrel protein [Polaromonas sp.]